MTSEVLKEALIQVVTNKNLSEQEMSAVMQHVMTGKCLPEQIAAFLTAIRMKGETAEEVTGAVKVMRSLASGVEVNNESAIDIVGTGGDGASLLNVSTASALICAAAGITVAKHGNYGFSSSSGSANVLQAAGVNVYLNADQVKQCIDKLNVGFMFAPQHHAAMHYVGAVRKVLGFRTFMNLMGPLTNPAKVKRQLTGVYDKSLCHLVAEVLANTGSKHVMVVHSRDKLDEISPVEPTFIVEYKEGTFSEYQLDPRKLGFVYSDLKGLIVDSPEDSLALIQQALGGGVLPGDARKAADMLALNAGAAIYISGKETSLEAGINKALSVIASGDALVRLHSLAAFSQTLGAVET